MFDRKEIPDDIPNNHYLTQESSIKKFIENKDNISVTWLGHASFLIKLNNECILTDPFLTTKAGPFGVGPSRYIKPGIKISDLPKINTILISHNHYDHLDIASLRKLSNINHETIFLVPEGDKKLLVNENIKNTFEFKWWDNFQLYGTTFTFTPAKHWSARGLFDESRSLWGSWHVENQNLSLLHAGDTGYSDDFKIIKKRPLIYGKNVMGGTFIPEWFKLNS